MTPTRIGTVTASAPGAIISRSDARTEMSTQRGVVGRRGAGHDAGIVSELAANFLDHRRCGATDGADGERGEDEDQRGADQAADEDLGLGEVDDLATCMASPPKRATSSRKAEKSRNAASAAVPTA